MFLLFYFDVLKCYRIPTSWHRIKQCLGYPNVQEREICYCISCLQCPQFETHLYSSSQTEGLP